MSTRTRTTQSNSWYRMKPLDHFHSRDLELRDLVLPDLGLGDVGREHVRTRERRDRRTRDARTRGRGTHIADALRPGDMFCVRVRTCTGQTVVWCSSVSLAFVVSLKDGIIC